ncbi:hypothetical protein Y1Q_0021365 [Alligator mississippiensis]|uniref:Uncharacterized protein n=1 Tax=Alligator mississippiensis TaxID=8496 RepID=A0A151P9I5_ALLMI|nr:hypothetical protein Y1Q_0021365 [Alligator mississippiensis]
MLDCLPIVAKELLVDSQAWHTEDIMRKLERDTHEEERAWQRDQVDQEFWDRLLALKERHLEAQEWQVAMVARTVETTEEDH